MVKEPTLDDLTDLSKTAKSTLEKQGWTLRSLSTTTAERLQEVDGFKSGTRAQDTIEAARKLVNAFDPDKGKPVDESTPKDLTPWEPVPLEPHRHSVRVQRLIDSGAIKVDEWNRII